jgi:hypothetical protein
VKRLGPIPEDAADDDFEAGAPAGLSRLKKE